MPSTRSAFWTITLKTVVVHTVTYIVMGILASTLFDYAGAFASSGYSAFMRQLNDPMVAAGPLLQPIRGVLFGVVFYLLRDVLFAKKNGWLVCWITLVFVGVFSTFGPSPGSIEGMIYTTLPIGGQLGGLIEILVQSLPLSVVTIYWVNHPEKRWLNWLLGTLFVIGMLLPALGLLASRATTG